VRRCKPSEQFVWKAWGPGFESLRARQIRPRVRKKQASGERFVRLDLRIFVIRMLAGFFVP